MSWQVNWTKNESFGSLSGFTKEGAEYYLKQIQQEGFLGKIEESPPAINFMFTQTARCPNCGIALEIKAKG